MKSTIAFAFFALLVLGCAGIGSNSHPLFKKGDKIVQAGSYDIKTANDLTKSCKSTPYIVTDSRGDWVQLQRDNRPPFWTQPSGSGSLGHRAAYYICPQP